MVAHLDAMLARHAAGEPLAYVLGRWGFRHLDLAVDRRVLIPRPETEVVAGVALELARDAPRPVTVADLGTGSGAIGLALADELPVDGVRVWLTDVDPDALAVARANLAGIGRRAANVRIAEGSWFEALPADVELDVAVANPPYVAEGSPDVDASVRDWEPPGALFAGPDGLDAIRTLVATGAGPRQAGRVAGAGDRRRPGPAPSRRCSDAAATATWRSGPISPAAIGSPSAASAEPDGDLRQERALLGGDVVVDADQLAGGGEQRPAQHAAGDAAVDVVEQLGDLVAGPGLPGPGDGRARSTARRRTPSPASPR